MTKPYPGDPTPPVTMGSKGFNVATSGQDSQARIPQFSNFVGSHVGYEQAVNKTNVAATSPMKFKSVPNPTPEIPCEKGWYISPFDGKKRMTEDNLAFVEQQRAEFGRISQQSVE